MKLYKSLLLVGTSLLQFSCNEYQKLLKDEDTAKVFSVSQDYYKQENYKKAISLLGVVIPKYRGRPEAERALFFEADSYYQLGDFVTSGYKMSRFYAAFPNSSKSAEAQFKAAKSVFELSANSSLDQKETQSALEKLQEFIQENPESTFVSEANECIAKLQYKLDEKYYNIAKRYHHREMYKAAITAFSNYMINYPGSSFNEKALYYKQESAYLLAINSFENLTKERLMVAQEYNNSYLENAIDQELKKKAEEISDDLFKRISYLN